MEIEKDPRWSEWVRRGNELVGTDTATRWALGDLALDVEPVGDDGVKTGAYDRLDQLADVIDVPGRLLRAYREISDRWPASTRVEASWSVHRVLAYRPNRAQFLGDLVAEFGRVTVKLALAADALDRQNAQAQLEILREAAKGLERLNKAGAYVGPAEAKALQRLVDRVVKEAAKALQRQAVEHISAA